MGLSFSIKMNRERLPTSGARASEKVILRLTRAELRAEPLLRGKVTEPQPGPLCGSGLFGYFERTYFNARFPSELRTRGAPVRRTCGDGRAPTSRRPCQPR